MTTTAPSADLESVSIRLRSDDNVVLTTSDLEPGRYRLGDETIELTTAVPRGHKIATRAIAQNEPVLKYGQVIGFAHVPIAPGEHVHTQNCDYRTFERSAEAGVDARPTVFVPEAARATFQGIRRPDGKVATRNWIGVLTTVNCSATAAKLIAAGLRPYIAENYPTVDGIVALTHGTGCGMAGPGSEGFEILRRTMTGYAAHPNFAGFLVLGLGCEVNEVSSLVRNWDIPSHKLVQAMTIQDAGGTRKAVQLGSDALREMLPEVSKVERETVPASELVLGMECGGSDGYSGITANPALGVAADTLIANGGTAAFGETPEIYGAEHLLIRRAVSQEVGDKLAARIAWWEEYTATNNGSMDNNPSPGNKAGGLTTILEKSLGAAAKGGSTNLVDVVEYAEPTDGEGAHLHGHPGLRPGERDRPGGRWLDRPVLHDRPRLGVRLLTHPEHQAGHELGHLPPDVGRHGRQLRHDRRRHQDGRRGGRRGLRQDPVRGLGGEAVLGGTRVRPGGVRSLAARRGDVAAVQPLGPST